MRRPTPNPNPSPNPTPNPNPNPPTPTLILTRWLRGLGLPARATELHLDSLPEWRDGLRLCEVVEVLERRQLAGVTRAPRSSASFRHNVEKALGPTP